MLVLCVESCDSSWSVCEIVLVPCVVGVVRVLLFVWDVSMLRDCESARVRGEM